MYVVLKVHEMPLVKARWLSWLERRPVTAEVVGSSPIQVATFLAFQSYASVAQSVEQRTENPRVVGSIPTGGTIRNAIAFLI